MEACPVKYLKRKKKQFRFSLTDLDHIMIGTLNELVFDWPGSQ